jgi:hypothetical protein
LTYCVRETIHFGGRGRPFGKEKKTSNNSYSRMHLNIRQHVHPLRQETQ